MDNMPMISPSTCRMCQAKDQRIKAIERERDRATAKLATARVCEECEKGKRHKPFNCYAATLSECTKDEHYEDCPHCTNGVVISDERARELMAINTAAIALSAWLEETGKEPDIAEFNRRSVALREAIRAARAKEGAAE